MINKVSWYRDHSFTVEESLGFKRKVFHKNQLRSLICYLAAKPSTIFSKWTRDVP